MRVYIYMLHFNSELLQINTFGDCGPKILHVPDLNHKFPDLIEVV